MIASERPGFVRRLIFLLAGPLIWFAHFSLIYGVAGFGGALGLGGAEIRLFAWAATLAAGLAILATLWVRGGDPAMEPVRRALSALSLAAVAFQALVLWIVPA